LEELKQSESMYEFFPPRSKPKPKIRIVFADAE